MLRELLVWLEVDPARVAVELDRSIVQRQAWDQHPGGSRRNVRDRTVRGWGLRAGQSFDQSVETLHLAIDSRREPGKILNALLLQTLAGEHVQNKEGSF